MQYCVEFRGKMHCGDAQAIKYFENSKIELGWEISNLEGYAFQLEFFSERNGIEIRVKKEEKYERVLDAHPPSFLDAINELPSILEKLSGNNVSK